ncbi:alpha carbonic anhydrase 2 [Perilla frutescens var. hirtella]|uniref:Carbonic anhydrase n=1 Tax=Perilla frutescens var. hirtella TaxID=608512 RepID=A0AAD4IMC5_PERFH|nr:alpha carbonic anhydrase 2 [Perilla frutescens var. hirtella]
MMIKNRSKNNNILNPILIVLLILLGSESISAQEVEDEREFEYAEKSEKGPRKWGEMKKEWGACSNGSLQSPVDISNDRVIIMSKQEKKIHYRPSNASLKNRGHDIQIQWFGEAGSIFINGTDYPLRQAHWHSPSEHTINGRSYDMELHLVHLSTDPNVKNKIAVLGVLYKIGKPDKFLSKLMRNITSMTDKKHEEKAVGMIDPADIKLHSKRYYRYMGSLTVPPCTEGVIWTINKKVKSVSRDQVKSLREAVHDYAEKNARPLQAKHNRDMYLYSTGNAN